MTIEQVKEEAKKRFGQNLTDEEAHALLDQYGGEMSDEALGSVSGGNCTWRLIQRPSDFDWKNW